MQFAIIAKVPSHNSSLHAENKKLHRKSEYCGRIDVILIKISFHFVHTVCTYSVFDPELLIVRMPMK